MITKDAILELDCGNTRIKWRLREANTIFAKGSLLTVDGLSGLQDAIGADIEIKRVFVGSVLGEEFARKIASWSLSVLRVNPEFAVSEPSCRGVINGYQLPEKLGVDRWLAILAAKLKTPSAVIVVDCGSAITVDIVTSEGEHLGGYIAPGLRLMRESLELKTASIKLGQIGYPENAYPGRNTVAAIKSAELAMLLGLIEQARAALRSYQILESELWVTGGDGEWLASKLDASKYVEDLVLDGLRAALDGD